MMNPSQENDPSARNDRLVKPSVTRSIVREHGFQFKKSLGQNFLVDARILDQIVEAADLSAAHGALEIGPGIGTLTQELAEHAGIVVAVEKDARLIPLLAETLASYPNVHVEQADVLELDLHHLWETYFTNRKVSVVANLPYYVTTPIVMKLLEDRLPLHKIVVMVQREVADRMNAAPGGKEYGVLSIAVQYYSKPEIVCRVASTSFMPEPGVESTVIQLSLRDKPAVAVHDEALFFQLVRASFAQRRKTLLNNLQNNLQLQNPAAKGREFWNTLLHEAGIDPIRRAETLSLDEFAVLTEKLHNL